VVSFVLIIVWPVISAPLPISHISIDVKPCTLFVFTYTFVQNISPMKKILFAMLAITLLIASCNKDNTTTTTTAPVNQWTFKGNTWYTFISQFHGDTLTAVTDTTQSGYNGVSFVFASVPTDSGVYRVVNYATIPTGKQVTIFYTTYGSANVFRSMGFDSVNATVTVKNGKVAITVPNVYLQASTTAIDSSQFYGTITQIY
jgi:hypothetical protein